jgi:PAS domain S-box-containing protein
VTDLGGEEREVRRPSDREPAANAIPEPEAELADFLPDAYLVTDANGVVRRANRAAAELLGRPQWHLAGKPLAVFVVGAQRQAFRREITALAGQLTRIDDWKVRFTPTRGEPFDASVTVGGVRDTAGRLVALRWLVRAGQRGVPSSSPGPGLLRPQPTEIAGDPSGARAMFLAQASELLASTFDSERTLASVAQLAVPRLADWCLVDLLDGAGQLRRLHVAHANVASASDAAQLAREAPDISHGHGPVAHAVLRGEGDVIGGAIDSALLASFASGPEQMGILERLRPRSVMVVPMAARGRTLGLLTFFMSESGRHYGPADLALAAELARRAALAAENAQLYAIAQRASQAKSDFLAAMSHELRTPLAAIVGYAGLLAEEIDGPLNAGQKEHLRRIRLSSDHLREIIEEILTFARVDAGKERVRLEPVDVASVAEDAVALVTPQAQQHGLELHVTLPPAQVRFESDAGKLRQILVNLLGNAVKFTERGMVSLAVSASDAEVTLEVADTGVGIARHQLERIFEPFWQVEQGRTRPHGGTGLGLTVVRELARMMGGDVEVESTPGRGTRFVVRLPRPQPAATSEATG